MFNKIDLNSIQAVEIEASTYCNAGCPYCARHDHGTSKTIESLPLRHIPFEVFNQLREDLDFMSLNKSKEVELWFVGNLGDAIMHPKLPYIWEYCAKNFKTIELETNGGVRPLKFWKEAGRVSKEESYDPYDPATMVFAIDGLKDTNHLYRKGVDWDRLISNAEAYINAGGNAEWKYLVFEHNQHQVDEAEKLAKKLGFAKFLPQYSTRYSDDIYDDEQIELREKEGNFLSSNVNQVIEEEARRLNIDLKNPNNNIDCKYIEQKRIYINSHGRVWPCCWHSLEYDTTKLMLQKSEPWMIPFIEKGFNDYTKYSLKEIASSRLWEQMTDAWENEKRNNDESLKMKLCYDKCSNTKWKLTCNISKRN